MTWRLLKQKFQQMRVEKNTIPFAQKWKEKALEHKREMSGNNNNNDGNYSDDEGEAKPRKGCMVM